MEPQTTNVSDTKTEGVQQYNNPIYYFNTNGKFCISDLGCCAESERTIDVKLFDIANNEELLSILNLYYLQGNFGKTYTYQTRVEWFCGYLSAFKNGEREKYQYEKSLTNPTVRILIEDKSMMDVVLKCF